jgi:hypothetical protein
MLYANMYACVNACKVLVDLLMLISYIASIAIRIRIMSDTRDKEQEQKDGERDKKLRCVARHPRCNCTICCNTGNIFIV